MKFKFNLIQREISTNCCRTDRKDQRHWDSPVDLMFYQPHTDSADHLTFSCTQEARNLRRDTKYTRLLFSKMQQNQWVFNIFTKTKKKIFSVFSKVWSTWSIYSSVFCPRIPGRRGSNHRHCDVSDFYQSVKRVKVYVGSLESVAS